MNKFRVGEFLIEPQLNNITGLDHSTRVEPKVMQVLLCLVDHADEVVSKEKLIQTVWTDTFVTDDVLTRSISELRKVFKDPSKEPRYIQTIPRSGYRLIAAIENEITPDLRTQPAPSVTESRFAFTKLLSIVAALMLVAIVVSIYLTRTVSKTTPTLRIVPFTSFSGREDHPAFSPDGNQIAFAWDGDNSDNTDVYVKSVGGERPLRLTTNPAVDVYPTWSPDGQKIAFIRIIPPEPKFLILSISALGTSPERVLFTTKSPPQGLTWSPDGKLIATSDSRSDQSFITMFSPDTGENRQFTAPPAGYPGDSYPVFSPDGKNLAFIRRNTPITADIYVVSITGGEPRRVTNDNAEFFFSNGVIGGLSWSADGSELFFSSNRGGIPGLWRVALAGGEPQRLAAGGNDSYHPTASARGNRLAYTQLSVETAVYKIGLSNSSDETRVPTKLFASSRSVGELAYSPDGKKIAFGSDRSGVREIWACDSDGNNLIQLTAFGKGQAGTPKWSPDGNYIAFDYRVADTSDIYVMNVSGGPPRCITTETPDDSVPSWSHDGKYLYVQSSRGGGLQIWRIALANSEAKQLTHHGGLDSYESSDGKYLYYSSNKWSVWRVPVEGGDEELVLDQPNAGVWGQWAVVTDNLYFIRVAADGACQLSVFSVATRQTRQIMTVGNANSWISGLSVSRDEQMAIFTKQTVANSDIMLVENFR